MITLQTKKLLALFALTAAFAAMYFYNAYQVRLSEERVAAHQQQVSRAKIEAYKNMNLIAESALVFDMSNNQSLYEFRAYVVRPLASITKVMTAVVAADILDPRETVTITPQSLLTEGENGLVSGEVWNSRDLISYMLVVSSNDAAVAIADTAEQALGNGRGITETFTAAMNRVAREIGMTDTVFYNESGLDLSETRPGAVGSAFDVARMVAFAYSHDSELFIPTTRPDAVFQSRSLYTHTVENTNDSVNALPGILLSKTGFTDLAGGNLVIVVIIEGKPYALVVLGSTETGRFVDMEMLYRRTKTLVESGILD